MGALFAAYAITIAKSFFVGQSLIFYRILRKEQEEDAEIKGRSPQIRGGKREKSEMLLDNALHLLPLVFYRLPYLKSFYEIAEIATGWLSPECQTA
jgi:hypothetical protein